MFEQLEAQYINLPCDEEEGEDQLPYSPLSNPATTPPLSPCSQLWSPESLSSPCFLPGSPPFQSPFLSTLPLSWSAHRTISPYEIFSPLPPVEEDSPNDATMEEVLVPPTPIVPTQSLPETPDRFLKSIPPSLPNPPPSRSPSPPVAGPSSSPLKRSRWFKDESGDESEFTPQVRKKTRAGKRSKPGSLKRAGPKFEGRGTVCDLCGMHLGRVTDLPRHKVSCKFNPERVTRQTPCEICGKPLPGNSILRLSTTVSYTRCLQSVRMQSNATSHPKPVVPNERRAMMKTRTCRSHSRCSRTLGPPCIIPQNRDLLSCFSISVTFNVDFLSIIPVSSPTSYLAHTTLFFSFGCNILKTS